MSELETQLRALAVHRASQVPTRPRTDDEEPEVAPPPRGARPWRLAVAAAVVVLAGIVTLVATLSGGDDEPDLEVATSGQTLPGTMTGREVVERDDWAAAVGADEGASTFALARIGDAHDTIDVAVSDRAGTEFLPASTFKLLSTLILLDTGVVDDIDDTVAWDGVTREVESWNQDLTLREALRESAVWVYQRLVPEVDPQELAVLVAEAEYGNADTGGAPDSFWLDGELRISAVDQLAFLERLALGHLPFDEADQASVLASLPRLDGPDSEIRYKTGTVLGGDAPVAWLVGVVDTAAGQWVFAYNVDLTTSDGEPRSVSAEERLVAVVDLLVAADVLEA